VLPDNTHQPPADPLPAAYLRKVQVGIHLGRGVEVKDAQKLGGHLSVVVVTRKPPQECKFRHLNRSAKHKHPASAPAYANNYAASQRQMWQQGSVARTRKDEDKKEILIYI
jgi:hypothetical protein